MSLSALAGLWGERAQASSSLPAPALAIIAGHLGGPPVLFSLPSGDDVPGQGLMLAPGGVRARDLQPVLDRDLAAFGIRTYLVADGIGRGPDALALLASSDPYDVLRAMRTRDAAGGLDTEQLVRRLQSLQERHPFELLGAGPHWVEARLPDTETAFGDLAMEVHLLCPEMVLGDEEVEGRETAGSEMKDEESVGFLERHMRRTRDLVLRWDPR